MVVKASFLIIIMLSLLLSSVFRKQFKESHILNCLAMLVAMTKSTLIGLIVAIWIPDIVFSTIIAMLLSIIFVSLVTYQLSIKVFVESLSALFMGSMMGTMLSLMTTKYELVCILFFTLLYIISTITAAALLNKEKYQKLLKAIPIKVVIISIFAVLLLVISTFLDTVLFNEIESESDINHDHHNHE
ncbi:hypothetical protein U5N28_19350 [Lysinibacillus telephonicus]|uniref:Uncharacterized protein n=1 Tax=Lysinibacillus telephonicus TaxID=1714840 RepID=A0A3S0KDT0_9BACI|nr:hypothetical protein [Lysinibacillus telephonicus]RTQ89017.1 hypothetical protein EKG35_17095 [Lysinibacillus telephonicus]